MADAVVGQVTTDTPPAAAAAPVLTETQWYDKFESTEVKEWVGKVGLKSPEAAAMKAYNQEKFLGADKAGRGIVLPSDASDKAAWEQVYNRIGRPEKPDGYKLPEGELAKAIAPILHEAGVTQSGAERIANWWNEHQQVQQQQAEAKATSELEGVKKEWGGEYEQRVELARRAGREVGLTEQEGTALVHAFGTKRALEVMHFFGKQMGENKVAGMSQPGQSGFGMNKEDASSRIDNLKRDKAWTARYLQGDTAARLELSKLLEIVST